MFVRKHAVEELTERIKRGNIITKQSVINESEFPWQLYLCGPVDSHMFVQ